MGHKEGWALKNWCSKTQPVNPKGNQPWIFTGKTDAEAEALILWPPDKKNWFIGKDPDPGKDWRQEEKGATEDEMVGWHHLLNGHEFEKILGEVHGTVHGIEKSRTWLSDWTTIKAFTNQRRGDHSCLGRRVNKWCEAIIWTVLVTAKGQHDPWIHRYVRFNDPRNPWPLGVSFWRQHSGHLGTSQPREVQSPAALHPPGYIPADRLLPANLFLLYWPSYSWKKKSLGNGFPGGSVIKNLPANEGDLGWIPGPGRSHMLWTAKLMCHNYWACALEPGNHHYWARAPRVPKTREATMMRSPHTATREQPPLTTTREKPVLQRRPSTARNTID